MTLTEDERDTLLDALSEAKAVMLHQAHLWEGRSREVGLRAEAAAIQALYDKFMQEPCSGTPPAADAVAAKTE